MSSRKSGASSLIFIPIAFIAMLLGWAFGITPGEHPWAFGMLFFAAMIIVAIAYGLLSGRQSPQLTEKQQELSNRLFAQLDKKQQAEILHTLSLAHPKDSERGLYVLLVQQEEEAVRQRKQQVHDLAEAQRKRRQQTQANRENSTEDEEEHDCF